MHEGGCHRHRSGGGGGLMDAKANGLNKSAKAALRASVDTPTWGLWHCALWHAVGAHCRPTGGSFVPPQKPVLSMSVRGSKRDHGAAFTSLGTSCPVSYPTTKLAKVLKQSATGEDGDVGRCTGAIQYPTVDGRGTVTVRRSKHGNGLFAGRSIPENAKIAYFEVKPFPSGNRVRPVGQVVYLNKEFHGQILPARPAALANFTNSAVGSNQRNNAEIIVPAPNLKADVVNPPVGFYAHLRSTRSIPAGTEILASYGSAYGRKLTLQPVAPPVEALPKAGPFGRLTCPGCATLFRHHGALNLHRSHQQH